MTETEFLSLAEATLAQIEQAVEQLAASAAEDIECMRHGNVLEIELAALAAKIVINSQAAMQEIWLAAKSGGFHYRYSQGKWRDTRHNSELFDNLSVILSAQLQRKIVLSAE